MDDSTIAALEAALLASPDNHALRLVVTKGHWARDATERAWATAAELSPDGMSIQDRALVARIALSVQQTDAALRWAPPEDVIRARALLAADRSAEAETCYRALVESNPAVQDLDLEQLLAAHTPELPADRPRLRVISNDPEAVTADLTRLLQPPEDNVNFADVGGLDGVKKEIRRRIILPFQKPSLFRRFKRKAGGGVLMYGPPGCGKTLLARATAGECNAKFISVAISDVLDMYTGESEKRLAALFDMARRSAPSVLFFDEIEALGGKREYGRSTLSAQLVSQLLAEMDGFGQNNAGVLVLGATNVPWAVDPAFRRPGRFDRVLFVPPPGRQARAEILRLQLTDRPIAGDIDVDFFAKNTSGFTGADLSGLVEAAADEAIERSIELGRETPIDQDAMRRALRESRSTATEWLTTARNYARYANEGGQYDEVLKFLAKHGKS